MNALKQETNKMVEREKGKPKMKFYAIHYLSGIETFMTAADE